MLVFCTCGGLWREGNNSILKPHVKRLKLFTSGSSRWIVYHSFQVCTVCAEDISIFNHSHPHNIYILLLIPRTSYLVVVVVVVVLPLELPVLFHASKKKNPVMFARAECPVSSPPICILQHYVHL